MCQSRIKEIKQKHVLIKDKGDWIKTLWINNKGDWIKHVSIKDKGDWIKTCVNQR